MAKRDEYIEKLKTQLDEWNAEIAKWEAKSREAQAAVQAEYEQQLGVFRRQRDRAMEQMHRLQASSGDAWKDLVRGTDEAWARMREAIEKARSHFK